MAGIYIHIPFCRQACHYCNFHFSTSLRYKNELLNALLKEAAMQHHYLGGETVETIYIGGGTPSLLSDEDIRAIPDVIRNNYPVSPGAEITLEANPDDISAAKLSDWKNSGINRLSIGIQSFFEEDLQWMNRAHHAGQAKDSLQLAAGFFENITVDLIYGSPQLTNENWKHNVDTVIAAGIHHISCYALTVEPKTPLQKMIERQQSPNINPDKQSEQFLLLMNWLETAGYEHYEISNFAKPGHRSRHNSSYWQGKPYLGLGPSAHSFNGISRQWNVSNNSIYIKSISEGIIPFEREELTEIQQLNETIMISLRTMEGLSLNKLEEKRRQELLQASRPYISRGLMKMENDNLILTKEGKLLADGIAAALFF